MNRYKKLRENFFLSIKWSQLTKECFLQINKDMSYNLCKDEFSRSKLFLNVECTEDFYTFQV